MKLNFNVSGKSQADPFVFIDNATYYMYVTGENGIEMYSSADIFGCWEYKGIVCKIDGANDYWSPSIIKIENEYYVYFSCMDKTHAEVMHVACSHHPEGPFTNVKRLYDEFSIDSHMVKTESGLYLFYAKDNYHSTCKGTRIFIDKFIDPYTPENNPKEIIVPDFPEERYSPKCKSGHDWYTLEGPFWLQDNGWQYIMYSGGCYQDDTYHIGYAFAKTDETDLKRVDFQKYTDNGKFAPLIIKNSVEEGTGHNSVIKIADSYYCFYHGRDYASDGSSDFSKPRTARICRLTIKDGKIYAEQK